MKFRVTKIKQRHYVDCSISDCFPDGYWEAGYVNLRTVDDFAVSDLPGASNEQYGHDTAFGTVKTSIRKVKEALRKSGLVHPDDLIHVGDLVDLPITSIRRNKAMRREGSFQVYLA